MHTEPLIADCEARNSARASVVPIVLIFGLIPVLVGLYLVHLVIAKVMAVSRLVAVGALAIPIVGSWAVSHGNFLG